MHQWHLTLKTDTDQTHTHYFTKRRKVKTNQKEKSYSDLYSGNTPKYPVLDIFLLVNNTALVAGFI